MIHRPSRKAPAAPAPTGAAAAAAPCEHEPRAEPRDEPRAESRGAGAIGAQSPRIRGDRGPTRKRKPEDSHSPYHGILRLVLPGPYLFHGFWGSKSDNGLFPFNPPLNGGVFDHGKIMRLILGGGSDLGLRVLEAVVLPKRVALVDPRPKV